LITPSTKLLEEQSRNIGLKKAIKHTDNTLIGLSNDLKLAEKLMRQGDPKCLERYKSLVQTFQNLNDYDTSSYFQGKCLNFSIEHKFKTGEIDALIGLGICEEKVYQEKKAKDYLEQALNKAIEAQD